MLFSRRRALAVTPLVLTCVALTGAMIGPGRPLAATITDLAVTCDTAATPAVNAAAEAYRRATGVRVRIFPTAPGLVLPQIEREIQNDIIITQLATIDAAEKEGLLKPGRRAGPWRNPLVTVATTQPGSLEGSFAVPDPSPASDIDGIAILQHLGVTPGKIVGVIDSNAVVWTLAHGGARQGLLHQTEVGDDDRLSVVAPVPDDAWPPIVYAAAVTTLARRGDPAAFIAFLDSPEGQIALRSAGLETAP